MERKPDTTKPGLYVVVNSGRKRKPNLPVQYNSTDGQYIKRRPRIISSVGESCLPTGQSCSQNVSVFRNQIPMVATSVIGNPRPKLHRIQRRPIGPVCQTSGDELQEIMIGTMMDDDRISRDSMYVDPPMCVFPDGVMHPMFVDPERLTELNELQQALNRANLMIRELLSREKKLIKERDYFKNRMDAESQRAEEIEYILNEQTLRMKQVVSENVRWSTRYNQLKLHFGEEDIKNALGDLAPSGRRFTNVIMAANSHTEYTLKDNAGPDSEYVKLISADGHEFIIKREYAVASGTIRAMLSGPGQFTENENNEVHFREIPSHVLQKVCHYFQYKVRYTNSASEIPEFSISPEIALELLMAANFLDC